MRNIIALCLIFGVARAAWPQTNFVPVSNLNQSSSSSFGIVGNSSLAVSFTTGNTVASLDSASIAMYGGLSEGGSTSFELSIYSDSGGSPGSSLATLSGNNFPTNAATYTYQYTNASPLLLASNATYWIVASILYSGHGTPGSYSMWYLTSPTLDAGSVWTLGTSKVGMPWIADPGNYLQFSVTVNPIGPAILISRPIVLTYPAPDFPFVLQQNSSLVTTNWSDVTNATLAGVLSHQAVFILPPSGQQMFYRLFLQ